MAPQVTGSLAGLLAIVLLAGALAIAPGAAAQESSSACSQAVEHDLTTSAAIAEYNESGAATSTVSNTDVEVEDAPGFVKLHANNPNGYCVAYTVAISPEIVSPADLGTVENNNETVEATWRAIQNLSTGGVYTEVSFTLEAGGTATFAPSTVRVRSLSWTGEAKSRGGSILSAVSGWFDGGELEKRHYEITPANGSTAVTVPLERGNRTVDEWLATYSVGAGPERDVGTDASKPVYYTESDRAVTFHFNDERATVAFTANPKFHEKMHHSGKAYWSGITDVGSWLPGSDD